MKKLVLCIAIAAVATLHANAQVSFGIQAGANLATTKSEFTSAGTKTTNRGKTNTGFTAGIVSNIPIGSSLSFRPEVNFIQKGGKYSSSQTVSGFTSASTENLSLNFIEVPLNLVYNLNAGPGQFSIGVGPDFSFGLSGRDKYTQTQSGGGFPASSTSGTSKVKFDGKKDADLPASDPDFHLQRFDFGANGFIGYKLKMRLFFNAGYTYGFSNLNPNPNSSFKTAGLTLKAGFLFGGKSNKKED
jgi:hypothetical protein